MQGECPHCHKKINSVNAVRHAIGDLSSEGSIIDQDIKWTTFTCPDCIMEIIEGESNIERIREAVWGPPSS